MIQTLTDLTEAEWLAARKMDITSTEVSALFGLSPYQTAFELWHRKHSQNDIEFNKSERMVWGSRLESAIANGIAQDKNWIIRPMKEYMRDDTLRAGASFDFSIEGFFNSYDPNNPVKTKGLLEIKNVDAIQFKQKWVGSDSDDIEAPPHIELQVQHQLMISQRYTAFIGVLVGGNTVYVLKRTIDHEIINQIKQKIKEFWTSIDEGQPPPPEFEKDAEFIAKLYSYSEANKKMEATPEIEELANKYKVIQAQEKAIGVAKDTIKAQLLMAIGDYEKVKGNGFSISAGMIGPAKVEFERKGYRNFKVTFQKDKED